MPCETMRHQDLETPVPSHHCSRRRVRQCSRRWRGALSAPAVVDRYYDPQTGQFLSVDPLIEQTEQAYIYVNDNPVNGTDPTGLAPKPPRLSPAEEHAIEEKKAGRDYDHKLFNGAQKKLREGGKYKGEVNVQKRQSNYLVGVPPFKPLLLTPPQFREFRTLTIAAAVGAGIGGIIIIIVVFAFL